MAAVAYVFAFALRFGLSLPPHYRHLVLVTLPLLLACKVTGFWSVGLFNGWWRYVSVRDVEDIARGNMVASTLFLAALVFSRGLVGYPRSIFILDLMVSVMLMAGVRIGVRGFSGFRGGSSLRRSQTPVFILGRGAAGVPPPA